MPLRKIVMNKEKLAQNAMEINVAEDKKIVQKIIDDLKTMIETYKLDALSATQIGYDKRIFSVRYQNPKTKEYLITPYVNPVIVESNGFILDRETDPCLPSKTYIFPRSQEITMYYQTPMEDAEPIARQFKGRAATVIQQMVDHLDGIMIDDIGLEIDYRFDDATEDEKNELLAAYMQSLEDVKDQLNTEIEENKDLKQLSDAVKFIQSVRYGETKLSGTFSMNGNDEIIEEN